jgi:hypothetical protein
MTDEARQFPSQRSVTPWLAALATLLALALLVVGARMGWKVYERQVYSGELQALDSIVEQWERQPPQGVDPHVWREVTIVVENGLGNVCFTPDTVSLAELRRLRADVELRAGREKVSLALLDWLWQRLRGTGPHGAEYIDRMQPLWDEAKAAVEPPRQTVQ